HPYPWRRAPVLQPPGAGARAAVAAAASAAPACPQPCGARHLQVPFRGHRRGGLRSGPGHQGAGGGVSAAPELVLLAALDRNRAIGRDNDLPWRLPDDLRRFKALTL